MRQDDNGNKFEVDPVCTTYEEAEQLKQRLEQGHHKQMYWIVSIKQDARHGGVDSFPHPK